MQQVGASFEYGRAEVLIMRDGMVIARLTVEVRKDAAESLAEALEEVRRRYYESKVHRIRGARST